MRDSIVSAPTFSARMTSVPLRLSVPPVSVSPSAFSTGSGSPVIMDSSTAERPSTTTPSTGMLSPGRTRSRSPVFTASSGTSVSCPSAPMRRAVFGARSSSARIAEPVRSRALSSSTWPRKTSATITAAASK